MHSIYFIYLNSWIQRPQVPMTFTTKAHGTQHRHILLRLRTGEALRGEGFVDAWQTWTRQTGAVQGGHGHLSSKIS